SSPYQSSYASAIRSPYVRASYSSIGRAKQREPSSVKAHGNPGRPQRVLSTMSRTAAVLLVAALLATCGRAAEPGPAARRASSGPPTATVGDLRFHATGT